MSEPNAPFTGLHIIAPPSHSSTPTANATCRCGAHRYAHGKDAVLALISAYDTHRATCTGEAESAPTERKTAA